MSRALRLHKKHSRAEIAQKISDLKNDPASWAPGGTSMTKKAQSLHADLLWAHYWHCAPHGNDRIRTGPEQGKWW